MEKRGQAAMEFLMTYGWAILAAIIAIGVLAYFGVFSPGKLAGSAALMNSPFYVDSFKIDDADNSITMEVTQNLGDSIYLVHSGTGNNGFLVTLESPGTVECVMNVISTTDVFEDIVPTIPDGIADNAWTSGTRVTIQGNCTTNWAEGDQVRANIKATYRKSGSGLEQQSTGSVRGISQ